MCVPSTPNSTPNLNRPVKADTELFGSKYVSDIVLPPQPRSTGPKTEVPAAIEGEVGTSVGDAKDTTADAQDAGAGADGGVDAAPAQDSVAQTDAGTDANAKGDTNADAAPTTDSAAPVNEKAATDAAVATGDGASDAAEEAGGDKPTVAADVKDVTTSATADDAGAVQGGASATGDDTSAAGAEGAVAKTAEHAEPAEPKKRKVKKAKKGKKKREEEAREKEEAAKEAAAKEKEKEDAPKVEDAAVVGAPVAANTGQEGSPSPSEPFADTADTTNTTDTTAPVPDTDKAADDSSKGAAPPADSEANAKMSSSASHVSLEPAPDAVTSSTEPASDINAPQKVEATGDTQHPKQDDHGMTADEIVAIVEGATHAAPIDAPPQAAAETESEAPLAKEGEPPASVAEGDMVPLTAEAATVITTIGAPTAEQSEAAAEAQAPAGDEQKRQDAPGDVQTDGGPAVPTDPSADAPADVSATTATPDEPVATAEGEAAGAKEREAAPLAAAEEVVATADGAEPKGDATKDTGSCDTVPMKAKDALATSRSDPTQMPTATLTASRAMAEAAINHMKTRVSELEGAVGAIKKAARAKISELEQHKLLEDEGTAKLHAAHIAELEAKMKTMATEHQYELESMKQVYREKAMDEMHAHIVLQQKKHNKELHDKVKKIATQIKTDCETDIRIVCRLVLCTCCVRAAADPPCW